MGSRGFQGRPGPAGAWELVRSVTLAPGVAQHFISQCGGRATAVSGMCGDAGNATSVKVIYSGRAVGDTRQWDCFVDSANFLRVP